MKYPGTTQRPSRVLALLLALFLLAGGLLSGALAAQQKASFSQSITRGGSTGSMPSLTAPASADAEKTYPCAYFENGGTSFTIGTTMKLDFSLYLGDYTSSRYSFYLYRGSYTSSNIGSAPEANLIGTAQNTRYDDTYIRLSCDTSDLQAGVYTAVIYAEFYSGGDWIPSSIDTALYYLLDPSVVQPTVEILNGDEEYACGDSIDVRFDFTVGSVSSKYLLYIYRGSYTTPEETGNHSALVIDDAEVDVSGVQHYSWDTSGYAADVYTVVLHAASLASDGWTIQDSDYAHFTLTDTPAIAFANSSYMLTQGMYRDLTSELLTDTPADCVLTTGDADVICVNGQTVYACGAGTATLTASCGGKSAVCSFRISEAPLLNVLPAGSTAIGDSAFEGSDGRCVILSDQCDTIGSRAFANMAGLTMVSIPAGVSAIADNAFSGSPNVWLLVQPDSYGLSYAKQLGLRYVVQTVIPAPTPTPTPSATPAPSPTPTAVPGTGTVTYRAFTVGQSYSGTTNALYGTIHDSQSIRSMLGTMSGTPYSVTSASDLTKSGILNGIASAFSAADSDDVSLFFYSGHGSDGGYLVGNDLSFLSPSELRSALSRIPGKKIVLVDACYSGDMIGKGESLSDKQIAEGASSFTDSFISAFYGSTSKSDLATDGFYVLTACSGTQTSIETGNSNGSYGVFTYAMTYGCGWSEANDSRLSSLYADSNGDGMLTLSEVYSYTASRVSSLGYSQTTRCYPDGSSQILFGR